MLSVWFRVKNINLNLSSEGVVRSQNKSRIWGERKQTYQVRGGTRDVGDQNSVNLCMDHTNDIICFSCHHMFLMSCVCTCAVFFS